MLIVSALPYAPVETGVASAAPVDAFPHHNSVAQSGSGAEVEPNDTLEDASPLAPDGDGFSGSGQLSSDDADDVFRLVIEGDPQLWLIEATGPGVGDLSLVDAAGNTLASASPVDGTAQIHDLFLPAGEFWIAVSDGEGEYSLSVTPLGPPAPLQEREPNDSLDRSQPLLLMETRTGRLAVAVDEDVYRFAIQNTSYLRFELDVPTDASFDLKLDWEGEEIVRLRSSEPGESLLYDAIVPPGDYALYLRAVQPSENPYALTVTPLDPFAVPVDLEPNDSAREARPMPASLRVSGIADPTHDGDDEDWYLLAPFDEAIGITINHGPEVRVEPMIPGQPGERPEKIDTELGEDGSTTLVEIPANTPILLRIRAPGAYDVEVMVPGGNAPTTAAAASAQLEAVEVSLDLGDQPIAAYWTDGQRIDAELTLVNSGDESLDLELEASTGHAAWEIGFKESSISLQAGETRAVPVEIRVAPDAWADQPVFVAVRSSDSTGQATAMDVVIPDRAASPLNSQPWSPLPPALLGGLDVAWTGLGAAPVAEDADAAEDQMPLFDQMITFDAGWRSEVDALPYELTVDLAGEEPVPIVGIILYPPGRSTEVGSQLRGFELELSTDGDTYTLALAGELTVIGEEQAFVLESPIEARYARLLVLSAQSPEGRQVTFGEWKVVAEPGWALPDAAGGPGVNLANPAVGGHMVDLQPPPIRNEEIQLLLDAGGERQTVELEPDATVSWTVGFHHDRAAQITAIGWSDPPDSDPAERLERVLVEVSTAGPTGPWTPLGEWVPARDTSGQAMLELETPAWARFVRFTAAASVPAGSDEEAIDLELPDQIRIHERAPDDTYRSVLAEWGGYRQDAIFEQLVAPDEVIELDADAGNDAASATLLPNGEGITNSAEVTVDEDWYQVDVPEGTGYLTLTLTGVTAIGVEATLFDDANIEIPITEESVSATEVTLTASVDPGESYYLRVAQPPTAIMFAFDTSGSIGTLVPTVYQGLTQFAGEILPGREYANILPFGEPMLLPDWSNEPGVVQGAVATYPRTADSSDVEGAILVSNEAFQDWEGNKAIILITDAEGSPTQEQMERLWPSLGATRPRTVAIHVAGAAISQHGLDLMQDWSLVNGGQYVYVRDQGDMDVAFDRAAIELRRPAIYTIRAEASAPPEDGSIEIVAPEGSLPVSQDVSVAIILDTSGSMLQGLEGTTRADIAKTSLIDLVTNTIPAGTTVSLRTFGDTPDSCETRLVVPRGPLDPGAMTETIAGLPVVNLVRTPIGASLEAVAGDLGTEPGPKIVVLVTDGEETCEGDPAAAIEALVASGIDVRVNIVGFAIDDAALTAQFTEWARLGNGSYIDAGNSAELNEAVATAVQPTFDVFDAEGTVVASGQVGAEPVAVPEGTYRVVVYTDPAVTLFAVTVESGQATQIPFEPAP